MSTKTAESDSCIGERVEALEQRIETLENQRERQREQNHALARENHKLREQAEKQSEEIEQLEDEIERAEDSRGHLLDDIIDVEQQIEDVEADSGDVKGGKDGTETTIQRPDLTPIERLSKIEDAEDTAIEVTPSIERAVTIYDHWEEWSQKTPKGRVLKDNLKTLLRTATGDKVNWRQSYRAAEALEKMSKGQIQFMKHKRHGKMLLEPKPANADQSHSVTATG